MDMNHMMNMETNRKFLNNNSGSGDHRRVSSSVFNVVHQHHNNNYGQHVQQDHTNNNTCSVRDKILAHPLFPRLLSSYLNCLKVFLQNNFISLYIKPYVVQSTNTSMLDTRHDTNTQTLQSLSFSQIIIVHVRVSFPTGIRVYICVVLMFLRSNQTLKAQVKLC